MTTLITERMKFMLRNGELQAESFSDTPYIFQNIHTLNHQARYLTEHLSWLNRSAKELFGEQLKANISAAQVNHHIEELLAINRLTRNASICVEIRLDAVGNYELRCHEPSLYAGYVLRSLQPEAICLNTEIPLQQHPTSAAIATRQLADVAARKNGFHTAILAERDGGLATEPCSPLFLVKEYTLFAQEGSDSVERRLTIAAAKKIGLKVVERRLMVSDLAEVDEVFTANWQGITAMAHIADQPYMSIMAEKIARAMEQSAQLKR